MQKKNEMTYFIIPEPLCILLFVNVMFLYIYVLCFFGFVLLVLQSSFIKGFLWIDFWESIYNCISKIAISDSLYFSSYYLVLHIYIKYKYVMLAFRFRSLNVVRLIFAYAKCLSYIF